MFEYKVTNIQEAKRGVLYHYIASSPVVKALNIKPLEKLYSEGNRHYHTYDHAKQVASAAFRLADLTITNYNEDKSEALYLAGMWHDAVYIHGDPDNEKLSAVKFSEYYDIPMASDLITNTTLAKHLSEETNDDYLDCLLDADLLSLGNTYDIFFSNNDNIIKESGVTTVTNEHRLMSAEFLNNFINKKNIYRTDICKRNFEHIARKNIRQYQDHVKCLT